MSGVDTNALIKLFLVFFCTFDIFHERREGGRQKEDTSSQEKQKEMR